MACPSTWVKTAGKLPRTRPCEAGHCAAGAACATPRPALPGLLSGALGSPQQCGMDPFRLGGRKAEPSRPAADSASPLAELPLAAMPCLCTTPVRRVLLANGILEHPFTCLMIHFSIRVCLAQQQLRSMRASTCVPDMRASQAVPGGQTSKPGFEGQGEQGTPHWVFPVVAMVS